jgi:two-component system, OmpR family, phosphate regulon sensor histidine kinase PhoR
VESIAADLGRGLNHARLFEAEGRLVEKLTSLDKAKSDFFATVSHELRSPLTSIEGYVEMLGDDPEYPLHDDQRHMVDAIERGASRLRILIDDVFTLAKLESGAFTAEARPVDIAELISGAVDMIRPSAAEKSLNPSVAGAEAGIMVNGVADTGIGIPEAEQEKLFNRFFRASNAVDKAIPGTGLGLAIIRTIVVNHGGVISLDSQEDAGSTFTVELPRLVSQPA